MRPRLFLALAPLLVAAVATPVLAKGGAAAPGSKKEDPLVVHEWGTFTSVQGQGGLVLEGLQHEEESLPDFVYSRAKVRDCPLRAVGWKGLEVPAEHVTQKMETPVVYFHSKTARRVTVRVDFVKGLLTQWYPVSDLLGPPEGARAAGPLDLAKVDRSFLQWEVDLRPGEGPAPAEMPAVAKDDPWSFARNVDAMWVRTVPRKGPERSGPTEADRFLFYRGLGTFDLPFRAEAMPDGTATFENKSPHEMAAVIALEVGPGAETGRFDVRGPVAAGERIGDLLRGFEAKPWKAGGVDDLKTVVVKNLVVHGRMAEDEAQAMVATWTRSWFLTEGRRVMYFVPRPLVDALLPLSIEPAPARIERALVGRIELVVPANVQELEKFLAALASSDAYVHGVGERGLAVLRGRLGRFLEANLRAVEASTQKPAVREQARVLLVAAAERESEPR